MTDALDAEMTDDLQNLLAQFIKSVKQQGFGNIKIYIHNHHINIFTKEISTKPIAVNIDKLASP